MVTPFYKAKQRGEYKMRRKSSLWLVMILIPLLSSCCIAEIQSQAGNSSGTQVFVNQVGYLPDMPKWVVSVQEAKEFTVIDEKTSNAVFTGTFQKIEDSTSISDIWQGEFTNFKNPGDYHIVVPGVGQSYSFKINPKIYNDVFSMGMHFYYLQRCGIEINDPLSGIKHPACHLEDALIARKDQFYKKGERIPSFGGWHDAGDYGKYVPTTTITIAQMLVAYELWPDKFADKQLQFPGSENTIPDLLDEAQYGLDWLFTMQRPDGAVYHKLAGARFPGFNSPDFDGQKRYIYGITTADTGKFAATMAIAARVLKDCNPMLADKAKSAAFKAWQFLEKHPFIYDHDDFDDEGSGAYGMNDDQVDRLWAALELSTIIEKDQPIRQFIKQLQDYRPNNINWTDAALLGLFDYTRSSKALPELKKITSAKIITFADDWVEACQNSGYRYALNFTAFRWGSNREGLSRGISMMLAEQLTSKSVYREFALAQLDFVLGLNPLSKCFVSGMGTNTVNSLHHRLAVDSHKMILGAIPGGPNNNAESGIEIPNLGPLSYSESSASYSSNEPAIDYNAPLVFLAAAFIGK
jgi:endoglucanase